MSLTKALTSSFSVLKSGGCILKENGSNWNAWSYKLEQVFRSYGLDETFEVTLDGKTVNVLTSPEYRLPLLKLGGDELEDAVLTGLQLTDKEKKVRQHTFSLITTTVSDGLLYLVKNPHNSPCFCFST